MNNLYEIRKEMRELCSDTYQLFIEDKFIPTNEKLYEMIKQLYIENKKLHKEIEKIKTHYSKYKKKNIIEWLSEEKNKSKILWKDYNDTITREHLLELFEGTRISCIKKIISDNNENIPLKSFSQQNDILYVFGANEEEKWTILSEKDFQNWMGNIKSKLLAEFLKWREETEIIEKNSESFIEKSIYYMTKVGTSKNEKTDQREIFKWLCKYKISETI